MATAKQLKD